MYVYILRRPTYGTAAEHRYLVPVPEDPASVYAADRGSTPLFRRRDPRPSPRTEREHQPQDALEIGSSKNGGRMEPNRAGNIVAISPAARRDPMVC